MTQNEAIFETPATHEVAHYSNPEFEWETHEASHYSNPEAHPYSNPYSNPELEEEWETHEANHYSNPYSNPEMHYSNPYSNPELEEEWETHEASHYSNPYSNPELENEWETHEANHYSNPYSNPEMHYSNPYSNPEMEDELEYEGDRFLGGLIKRGLGWLRRRVRSFARPVFRAVTSMVPGVGAIAGQLTKAIAQEGEMEAMQMEAEFFGTNAAEAEFAHSQAAQEAAMTEFLAAQAAESESEAEAEASLAAALPITISIMGARPLLRPVVPILTQANARLVRVLGRDPYRRQLRRLVPTMHRQAIGTLRAAARSGQPITGSLAVRALGTAAGRVLSNPRLVQRVIERNAVLRQRVAPFSPRRVAPHVPSRSTPFNPRRVASSQPMRANGFRCPVCATRIPVRRQQPRPIR